MDQMDQVLLSFCLLLVVPQVELVQACSMFGLPRSHRTSPQGAEHHS